MAKFLIIDDSKLARTMLKNILIEANHEVIAEAENGLEGEELYFKHKPDIVTLDNIMPGGSGKDCLKNILAKDPSAKIILISSVGKEKLIIEQLEIGAKYFIKKPFEKEEVLSAVNVVLKK
jgi:two-component system chemotaxis response regulator CheY